MSNTKTNLENLNSMFCFQCEQTAGCSGCTKSIGVCGKTANTANLQDQLTGALIGLAKACGNNQKTENTDRIIIEGLFTTVTNVNFNDNTLEEMIEKVHQEKDRIVPGCEKAGTKVYLAVDGQYAGCILITDEVKH